MSSNNHQLPHFNDLESLPLALFIVVCVACLLPCCLLQLSNYLYGLREHLERSRLLHFRLPHHPLITELFGLDTRSLALFRFLLGVTTMSSIMNRFVFLEVFFTDQGVFPRDFMLESQSSTFSLNMLSGSYWWQATLFLLAMGCSFMFLIGYHTWTSNLLLWFLLDSIHSRNRIINSAGDMVLRFSLFWSLFLPLGTHFSVDAALDGQPAGAQRPSAESDKPQEVYSLGSKSHKPHHRGHVVLTGGTVGLLTQLVCIYYFAHKLKTDISWTTSFTAIGLAASTNQALPTASLLLSSPHFAGLLTWIYGLMESWILFLPFIPIPAQTFRGLAVVLYITFHLVSRIFFEFGYYPWACITLWIALVPSLWWDTMARATHPCAVCRIHYTPDPNGLCKEFPRKVVQLMKTFLLLHEKNTTIQPFNVGDNTKSWIQVIDGENGRILWGNDAILKICRLSPWAKYFAFIVQICLEFPGVQPVNKLSATMMLYASNLLPFRPANFKISKLWSLLALWLSVSVVFWNYNEGHVKNPYLRLPLVACSLRQRWGQLAPRPEPEAGWWIIPATLNDTSIVDLYQDGEAVNWQAPNFTSTVYNSEIWRKWMGNMKHFKNGKPYREHHARWLCRTWNAAHNKTRQILEFSMVYIMRKIRGVGKTDVPHRIKLYGHVCSNYSLPTQLRKKKMNATLSALNSTLNGNMTITGNVTGITNATALANSTMLTNNSTLGNVTVSHPSNTTGKFPVAHNSTTTTAPATHNHHHTNKTKGTGSTESSKTKKHTKKHHNTTTNGPNDGKLVMGKSHAGGNKLRGAG